MRGHVGVIAGLFALAACGGAVHESPDGGNDGGTPSSSGGGSSGGSASGGSSDAGGGSASGGSSDAGDGSARGANDGGRVPVNHRPNDDQCSVPAPPGPCARGSSGGGSSSGFGDAGGNNMCLQDSDCTAGTNGRCFYNVNATCGCFYDTCLQDTDCPTGQTCACWGPPYATHYGNACVLGNCRVDTDCGGGGYCSLTGGGSCAVQGYYCHTPNDLCLDDSECVTMGSRFCAYSTTNARWECTNVGSSCGG